MDDRPTLFEPQDSSPAPTFVEPSRKAKRYRGAGDNPKGTPPFAGNVLRDEDGGGDLSTPHAYVSNDAPDTSELAAVQARGRSASLRKRVLDAIAAAGDHGATDDELQVQLGLRNNTQAPRRLELREMGWITAKTDPDGSKVTRRTRTGAKATVWVLTARAKARYSREGVA